MAKILSITCSLPVTFRSAVFQSFFAFSETKPGEFTDAGPGVGCNNIEAQFRLAEKQLCQNRQMNGLRVAELGKYIAKHNLITMKLKEKDKMALVEAHIGMTLFKELAAGPDSQQDDVEDLEEDEEIVLYELSSHDGDEGLVQVICQTYSMYAKAMICCDSCDEWYQGECVGSDGREQNEYTEQDMPYSYPFCRANIVCSI